MYTFSGERKIEGGLAAPTPPPRTLAPTKDSGDLGGGVRVADWRSRPRIDRGLRLRVPDPSIEVPNVLGGCRRPWWKGWSRRLAAPTPSPFNFSL
ncbi:hypothetical protein CRG98_019690 [Punica granatum]|uniref:Uncharacterized protein n=1 Tax=Punica granatum TaxID=22663 RepID=A0A2I0JUC7_PUNGR|nr:hypothetical protein CRG98_019690 [Punica granatum]